MIDEQLFSHIGWSIQTKSALPNSTPPTYNNLDIFLNQSKKYCQEQDHLFIQTQLKNIKPTASELNHISEACSRLWNLDDLRMEPVKDYQLDLQRTTYDEDRAPNPLFKYVNNQKLQHPVYKSFIALLDNYEFEPGKVEKVTREEIKEMHLFLENVMNTKCICYVYEYLKIQKLFIGSKIAFKKKLEDLWFDGYSRVKRGNDSSAFEHVFVGEQKFDSEKNTNVVIGSHNWLAWHYFETTGDFDYRGFKKPRGRRSRNGKDYEKNHLLSIVFEFHGAIKPVSTGFIGTSPAFELALYTLAYYCTRDKIACSLGDIRCQIQVYRYRGDKIGSCHPIDCPASADDAAMVVQARVRGKQERKRRNGRT